MINWVMLVVATVPGTPEPPAPIDPPDVWVTWFNDDWGIPNHGVDDNRTNAFVVAARVHAQCRVLVEHDMLTARSNGDRVDQALVGLTWKDEDITVVDFCPVVGIKLIGDLGGAWVQNHWHGPNSQVDLAYEDRTAVIYLGQYVHWSWDAYDRWHPDVSAAGTLDGHGDLAGDVVARGVFRCEHLDVWAGLRLKLRHEEDPVERSVAEFERGLWLDYGIALDQSLSIGSQWSLRKSDGVGAVSVLLTF